VCNSVDIEGRRHEITFFVPSMGCSGSLAVHEPDLEISLATPPYSAGRDASTRFSPVRTRDHLAAIESIFVVMETDAVDCRECAVAEWTFASMFERNAGRSLDRLLHISEVCVGA